MAERIFTYPAKYIFDAVNVQFVVDNNTNIFLVFNRRQFNRQSGQYETNEISYHATGELHEYIYNWLHNKER